MNHNPREILVTEGTNFPASGQKGKAMSDKPKPEPVDLDQVETELRAVAIVTETDVVNALTLVFPTGWQAADFPALFAILPALVDELRTLRKSPAVEINTLLEDQLSKARKENERLREERDRWRREMHATHEAAKPLVEFSDTSIATQLVRWMKGEIERLRGIAWECWRRDTLTSEEARKLIGVSNHPLGCDCSRCRDEAAESTAEDMEKPESEAAEKQNEEEHEFPSPGSYDGWQDDFKY